MSNFGPKISQQEYEARVTSIPFDTEETIRARLELDAQVDYKLGTQVPEDLRNKMFAKQMFLRKRHVMYLAMGLVVSPTDPLGFIAKKHV